MLQTKGSDYKKTGILTVAMALMAGLFSSDKTNQHSSTKMVKAAAKKSLPSKVNEYEVRKIRQGLKWFTVGDEKILALNKKNALRKIQNRKQVLLRHQYWLSTGRDFVKHKGVMYNEIKPCHVAGIDPVSV